MRAAAGYRGAKPAGWPWSVDRRLADGPLIYRSVGLVTIQRPEGSQIYEVSVESGGGSVGGEFTIPLQATAPDPATNQLWLNNTGGGLVLNASDLSSWFEV